MLRLLVLASCLLVVAKGTSEVDVDDTELLVFVSDDASAAVARAAGWILSQRDEATAWGALTPRAVSALALAAPLHPIPRGHWDLITKQLDVHLAMQLSNMVSDGLDRASRVSKLAIGVSSLLATCRDPRRFHGLDLVAMLRSETDSLLHSVRDDASFPLPAIFIPLCLAGENIHSDLARLARIYTASVNRTDVQALQLLGMSCMTNQSRLASARPVFEAYVREFAARFRAANNTDVYTKALAMQALHSGGLDITEVSSLLADQQSDGSFEGSLLATYHAIPALMGTSLLAIGNIHCSNKAALLEHSPPPTQSVAKSVQLSVWIGEGAERDTHSLTVTIFQNDTLLDVMRRASDRNHMFRFSSESSREGVRVYSLAGIPNDAEREVSWRLYTQKAGKNEHLREIVASVDKVIPSADDNIVFWFKRNSPQ